MELVAIKDPCTRGIDVLPHGNGYETIRGWYVEGFYDRYGNEYEKATKGAGVQRVERWFKLEEEE